MKPRTTLTLAIIAGGFFAYIWFVEQYTDSTREHADSAAKVVSVDHSKIGAIFLQNADVKIEIQKKDGLWRLEKPIVDRADNDTVLQLLEAVTSLKHSSKIDIAPAEEKEKLKEFGLSESDLSLKLKPESGKEIELLLGKDSAITGKIYVRLQGSNTAYVISNHLKTLLTKKTDEFRDKKLSDTPAQQVQKLSVKTPEGELELERKNNHWEIVKPLRARAADQKVNDLLAGILTAKVSHFLAETPTPEQGLGEPRATLTLAVEGLKEPLTLKVGATPTGDENKDKSFTRLSNRPAVTVLANSSLDPLLKARPNDVRDRKLARVETDIVDRITIEPSGCPKIVLARKGEGWIQKDGEQEIKINENIPNKLLSEIQSSDVTNFVSDVATDLSKYGLDHPKLKVTLSSYASENTAETKAGERPIVTALFGTVEGDSGYAKLEDEPFIVASPKSLLELFPIHNSQLQPLAIWDFKADAVTDLEITQEKSSVILEKKDNTWKLSGSEGTLDEPNLQTLLGVLGSLHTTKWLAPGEDGEKSDDHPTATIKITLKDGDKTSTQALTLGRALGTEGFYSKVSNKPGSFLLSRTDYSKLSLKLLK